MAFQHWSYSALRQYLECPLRFFFQRILALPESGQSAALVAGSATHEALAVYHRGLQTGEATDVSTLHRAITETWTEREANGSIVYNGGDNREKGIAQVVAMVETYLQEPPPENIIAVEQEVMSPVQNSDGEFLATPLKAIIDLLTETKDEITVHEFKTSRRNYSEFETEVSLQPTCYAAAIQATAGVIPKVQYTVLVKTKTPKVQHLQTTRTQADIGKLGDLIETVERAIEADIFYPIESPLHCSGCPYRRPCRERGGSFRMTPSHQKGSC